MTASGRSFSVAAKAPSNSSLLLILTGLIVVPVASPASWTFSRKGLEKGSVGHAACRWQQLPDEFDAFAGQLGGYASDAGDISAGARKARDQPGANRISCVCHHDRDLARRLLCRLGGGREPSDDHIDFEMDQLGG